MVLKKDATLTDDDLKRLNEAISHGWSIPHYDIEALLNRLEAAERICVWAKGICPDMLEKAWRASKGEGE